MYKTINVWQSKEEATEVCTHDLNISHMLTFRGCIDIECEGSIDSRTIAEAAYKKFLKYPKMLVRQLQDGDIIMTMHEPSHNVGLDWFLIKDGSLIHCSKVKAGAPSVNVHFSKKMYSPFATANARELTS